MVEITDWDWLFTPFVDRFASKIELGLMFPHALLVHQENNLKILVTGGIYCFRLRLSVCLFVCLLPKYLENQ